MWIEDLELFPNSWRKRPPVVWSDRMKIASDCVIMS